MSRAPFVHIVLFTLPDKPDAPTAADILADIDIVLRPLPTVRGIWAGGPADTKLPSRPMVDDDYDVGLLVLFDDKAGLDTYLADPQHTEFAKKWDSICTLRVFDFIQE